MYTEKMQVTSWIIHGIPLETDRLAEIDGLLKVFEKSQSEFPRYYRISRLAESDRQCPSCRNSRITEDARKLQFDFPRVFPISRISEYQQCSIFPGVIQRVAKILFSPNKANL